jgi:hypothetical protein
MVAEKYYALNDECEVYAIAIGAFSVARRDLFSFSARGRRDQSFGHQPPKVLMDSQ